MLLGLIDEKAPDKGLAVTTAILTGISMTVFLMGLVSILVTLSKNISNTHFPEPSMILHIVLGGTGIVIGVFIGIAAVALQAIVIYSWNRAINTNINNTKLIFQLATEKTTSEELKKDIRLFIDALSRLKISTWPFWIYIILFISIPFIASYFTLIWAISIVFLSIYLYSVFSTGSELSRVKQKAYTYFLESIEDYPQLKIKERSLLKVLLLSIVTIMVYWLYILIDFTRELEEFIKTDQLLRLYIVEKLK